MPYSYKDYSPMPKEKPATPQLVPAEMIERRILLIRGHKVMLDSHLAELYEVPTKRLNEAVKRNRKRFPEDFMFQVTRAESDSVARLPPIDDFVLSKVRSVVGQLGMNVLESLERYKVKLI